MVKRLFATRCGAGKEKKKNGPCHTHRSCRTVALSDKTTCGPARVCGITGDRKHCARLAALGLYPGNDIELIRPANGSECLIKVHGGTFSIDRDTTRQIMVTD